MLDKNPSGTSSQATVEQQRHGFWQLIQADMNFRLLHNMAPTTTRIDCNVNLPWLSYKPGTDGNTQSTVSTAAFIARSRLTFIGMEYTAALDMAVSDPFFDLEAISRRVATRSSQPYRNGILFVTLPITPRFQI